MGAEEDRRYVRAVMGASNRVTISEALQFGHSVSCPSDPPLSPSASLRHLWLWRAEDGRHIGGTSGDAPPERSWLWCARSDAPREGDYARMKAFGGRGMWFSGFFFPCACRRPVGESGVGGKSIDSGGGSTGEGGSLNVPGVTFGANAMF
ncbi:unnamed protein product [Somion occarium]|uniref:Uncharacterized protein n=1 Tax=Somion occarium TaxID=3059160 RepID=A0ABP1CW11_9APHY